MPISTTRHVISGVSIFTAFLSVGESDEESLEERSGLRTSLILQRFEARNDSLVQRVSYRAGEKVEI